MSTESNKVISLVEASAISAIMIKIGVSKHEFGSSIEFMAFAYDKKNDVINVQIDPNESNDSKVSLVKATLLSWWISQINQLERNHKITIKTMNAKFNLSNQQVETAVVYDLAD